MTRSTRLWLLSGAGGRVVSQAVHVDGTQQRQLHGTCAAGSAGEAVWSHPPNWNILILFFWIGSGPSSGFAISRVPISRGQIGWCSPNRGSEEGSSPETRNNLRMTASASPINVDALLRDLEDLTVDALGRGSLDSGDGGYLRSPRKQSLAVSSSSEVLSEGGMGRRPSIGTSNLKNRFHPPPHMARTLSQRSNPGHQRAFSDVSVSPGSIYSAPDEDDAIMVRRQLERERMEREHKEYLNSLALFQQKQQHEIAARQAQVQSNLALFPSVIPQSWPSSAPRASTGSDPRNPSNSSSTGRNFSPHLKSPTGWSGKASARQSNEIADAIIDGACDLGYEATPRHILILISSMICEFYNTPSKGTGANQAVQAICYVINLDDPRYVRRGLEVLDALYRSAGPVFWANVSLNLDFFQHFLETRKHTSMQEHDNIKFLCGVFAGWYIIDADRDALAAFNNLADPTVKVKEFFEGLVRASYEFPDGSLAGIPPERMAGITSWTFKRGISFATYKK
ncbi:hypothetical protein BC830DRAFT_1082890 [Chytriomyces sp. MP71]|nr:hypothetical protein BC830DRAFT_1082890 [Chytriomyces sp. MP71]